MQQAHEWLDADRRSNMRYVTRLLVALCICASVVHAVGPNSGQLSASEKQLADKQGTQNPGAYELYSKGRSYWSKRTLSDLETAACYFNQAIAKDPGYALAYSGLAASGYLRRNCHHTQALWRSYRRRTNFAKLIRALRLKCSMTVRESVEMSAVCPSWPEGISSCELDEPLEGFRAN